MTREELKQKAHSLPLGPGVYIMMDATGQVIYVGKSRALKNRVSQYFADLASHNAKTRAMVAQIDRFDYLLASSEFEALVLENSLIKRHKPRYNILLKDDKGYPYIRLSGGPYPRFSMVSKPMKDGARYFGPYGGRSATAESIKAICREGAALSQPPSGHLRRLVYGKTLRSRLPGADRTGCPALRGQIYSGGAGAEGRDAESL